MGRSIGLFYRLMAQSSEGASLVRRPGLLAAVCPAVPERSVFNGVAYADPGALAGELDSLAGIYEEAGVEAWTVWVPEDDRDSARLLEDAGHRLDAEPRAMGMMLDALTEPEPGDLDWRTPGSLSELARLNDEAYGYASGTFERAIGLFPQEKAHFYEARLDGEASSVLFTVDRDGDCCICFVATAPTAQRRGLAGRLLHLALAAARERGCETTTLQATKAGRPVYERLGYRDLGGLQMWERRK